MRRQKCLAAALLPAAVFERATFNGCAALQRVAQCIPVCSVRLSSFRLKREQRLKKRVYDIRRQHDISSPVIMVDFDTGYKIRKAYSMVTLPRTDSMRPITRSPTLLTVKRTKSYPNLYTDHLYVSGRYHPRSLYRYRRDYNLTDSYWWDRNYYLSPVYWPSYRMARRYTTVDPPYGLNWYYPGLTYFSRYRNYYTDSLDPIYWRRYVDPYYTRPLWAPYRPYAYETMDRQRAVRMYKEGLLNYSTLDKYWLTPSYWDKRLSDTYNDVYTPTPYYGARRYFYKWGW